MKKLLNLLIILAVITESISAAPSSLTCVPTDPPSKTGISVEVDLENRWIMLGLFKYDIVHLDNRYITAIQRRESPNVGAEVLVLNRITGDLKRAAVYVAATPEMFLDPENNPLLTSGELVAKTFVAQCSKPLL